MKKPCCQQSSNLTRQQVQPDLTIDVCSVCGCRHFVLKADPGRFTALFKRDPQPKAS